MTERLWAIWESGATRKRYGVLAPGEPCPEGARVATFCVSEEAARRIAKVFAEDQGLTQDRFTTRRSQPKGQERYAE